MATQTKSTSELKTGDVVVTHGARFRLTQETSIPGEPVRAFRTEFLGYSNPDQMNGIPSHLIPGWVIQGTEFARWFVE